MAAKTKQQEEQEQHEQQAGPAVPRERASADYEQPRRDVSSMPDPAQMPTNKARAGVQVRGMWLVLVLGIALTVAGYLIGVYLLY